MQEFINCPSCQRKLQVPEALLGTEVQCPTCRTTFTAQVSGPAPSQPASLPPMPQHEPTYPAAPPAPRAPSDYRDDYDPRIRSRRDLAPHRGTAILTLGILSIVIPYLGLITGPIAWTMG